MRFGSDLEKLFLLTTGFFVHTPAQAKFLQAVARTLGGQDVLPTITRAPNCVTIAPKHSRLFLCVEQTARAAGLQVTRAGKELRIFIT